MNKTNTTNPVLSNETPEMELGAYTRRNFLTVGGVLLGAGALGYGACKKDSSGSGVDLGTGDTGILNYAYALEQLEAAFYTKVIASPYASINSEELAMLTDIRDHEIAHREFFKAALAGHAIQDLEVDFSTINFTSRQSVLETARAFEDLGVQAYNGAGHLLISADNLTLAGKVVSVEARHAAYIRDLLQPGSFADTTIIEPVKRADYAKTPAEVLAIAGKYIKTKINANNLPTS